MDAAAVSRPKPAASELLLEHCFVLDSDDGARPTAAVRLEALLGSELARAACRALSPERARTRLPGPRSSPRRRTKRKIAPGCDEREDERRRARDADREHPDPEQQEEEHGPHDGLNPLVDRRHAQVHRRDPRREQLHRTGQPRSDPSSFRDLHGRSRIRVCRRIRHCLRKNSGSRWRFRPPSPLTFRFRVRPSSSDST